MKTDQQPYAPLRARLASAMRHAAIRDDEGEFPRLFDLLGFSGENKAHAVVNGLADAVIAELVSTPSARQPLDWRELYRQARQAEDNCALQDFDAPYAAGSKIIAEAVRATHATLEEVDSLAAALAGVIAQQDPQWQAAKARIAQLEKELAALQP